MLKPKFRESPSFVWNEPQIKMTIYLRLHTTYPLFHTVKDLVILILARFKKWRSPISRHFLKQFSKFFNFFRESRLDIVGEVKASPEDQKILAKLNAPAEMPKLKPPPVAKTHLMEHRQIADEIDALGDRWKYPQGIHTPY